MRKTLRSVVDFCRFLVLLVLCALTPRLSGSPGGTTIVAGYAVRSWQVEQGLPQNMVTSSVQTKDGYVWFGTYGGLAKFDGERFQIYDFVTTPALKDRRVSCLFEDSGGALWVGHESGLISKYRDGVFEEVQGSTGDKILAFGEDGKRRVWVLLGNGALVVVGSGEIAPSLIEGNLLGVMGWSCRGDGNIWVAENGISAQLKGNHLEVLSLPTPRTNNYVQTLAAASDGGVWLFCDDQIRKWKDGRWVEDRGAYPWPAGPLSCARELVDGTLAVGTIYSGLFLVPGNGGAPLHFDSSNGLAQNWVRFISEDRESGVWLGTGTSGVVRIQATPFTTLEPPDKWKGCSVLAVATDDKGSLWVGTDGAGLYRFAGNQWSEFGAQEGVDNGYIPSVAVASDHEVYMGYFWWGSPYRLNGDRFARAPGVSEKSSPVFSMLPSSHREGVLVGSRDGLTRLHGGQTTELFKSSDGRLGAVCALAEAPDGSVWCGFEEGGLAHFVDSKQTKYGRAEGLSSDSVRCLAFDSEGVLWIGTADGGLSRYRDGRFATIGIEHGLVDRYVGKILDDGLGYFWLSTHHGLQRVAISALNLCADGRAISFESQIYDNHDGLPTIEFTGGLQSSGCRTPDQRLWFASNKGLLSVDPKKIHRNTIQPPVVLESMLVDGKTEMSAGATSVHELAANHERIEFRFSGLSFAAPDKVRFKYRLEGIDGTWVDSGTRRTAYYSRLPAGDYEFRVIGCNNDNVWNLEGASLKFSVAPFFWNTWWFVVLCVAMLTVSTAFLVRTATRRRIVRKMEEMKRLHAVEQERSRIARDIHDDVGAILSQISMFSQPNPRELASPERSAATLSRIYTIAKELTRSFDEIVWAVDPRHDSLEGLLGYMGNYAQSFLAGANISCRLNLPVDVPAWPTSAETRHNLFLAFKEALNNVVKHAEASEVRISLILGDRSFVLEVRDDGRGLPDSDHTPPEGRLNSGHGLGNMKSRLSQIKGRCDVSGEKGKGTVVTFEVWIQETGTGR